MPFGFTVAVRVGVVVTAPGHREGRGDRRLPGRGHLPAATGAEGLRIRCTSPPGQGRADRRSGPRACLAHDPRAPPGDPAGTARARAQPAESAARPHGGDQRAPRTAGAGVHPPRLRGDVGVCSAGACEVFGGGVSLELDHDRPDEVFGAEDRFGEARQPREGPSRSETVRGRRVLTPGMNVSWISVTPSAEADLNGRADARRTSVVVEGEEVRVEPQPRHRAAPRPRARLCWLRGRSRPPDPRPGDDAQGNAAGRPRHSLQRLRDLPGRIDLGCSRSVDGVGS